MIIMRTPYPAGRDASAFIITGEDQIARDPATWKDISVAQMNCSKTFSDENPTVFQVALSSRSGTSARVRIFPEIATRAKLTGTSEKMMSVNGPDHPRRSGSSPSRHDNVVQWERRSKAYQGTHLEALGSTEKLRDAGICRTPVSVAVIPATAISRKCSFDSATSSRKVRVSMSGCSRSSRDSKGLCTNSNMLPCEQVRVPTQSTVLKPALRAHSSAPQDFARQKDDETHNGTGLNMMQSKPSLRGKGMTRVVKDYARYREAVVMSLASPPPVVSGRKNLAKVVSPTEQNVWVGNETRESSKIMSTGGQRARCIEKSIDYADATINVMDSALRSTPQGHTYSRSQAQHFVYTSHMYAGRRVSLTSENPNCSHFTESRLTTSDDISIQRSEGEKVGIRAEARYSCAMAMQVKRIMTEDTSAHERRDGGAHPLPKAAFKLKLFGPSPASHVQNEKEDEIQTWKPKASDSSLGLGALGTMHEESFRVGCSSEHLLGSITQRSPPRSIQIMLKSMPGSNYLQTDTQSPPDVNLSSLSPVSTGDAKATDCSLQQVGTNNGTLRRAVLAISESRRMQQQETLGLALNSLGYLPISIVPQIIKKRSNHSIKPSSNLISAKLLREKESTNGSNVLKVSGSSQRLNDACVVPAVPADDTTGTRHSIQRDGLGSISPQSRGDTRPVLRPFSIKNVRVGLKRTTDRCIIRKGLRTDCAGCGISEVMAKTLVRCVSLLVRSAVLCCGVRGPVRYRQDQLRRRFHALTASVRSQVKCPATSRRPALYIGGTWDNSLLQTLRANVPADSDSQEIEDRHTAATDAMHASGECSSLGESLNGSRWIISPQPLIGPVLIRAPKSVEVEESNLRIAAAFQRCSIQVTKGQGTIETILSELDVIAAAPCNLRSNERVACGVETIEQLLQTDFISVVTTYLQDFLPPLDSDVASFGFADEQSAIKTLSVLRTMSKIFEWLNSVTDRCKHAFVSLNTKMVRGDGRKQFKKFAEGLFTFADKRRSGLLRSVEALKVYLQEAEKQGLWVNQTQRKVAQRLQDSLLQTRSTMKILTRLCKHVTENVPSHTRKH